MLRKVVVIVLWLSGKQRIVVNLNIHLGRTKSEFYSINGDKSSNIKRQSKFSG